MPCLKPWLIQQISVACDFPLTASYIKSWRWRLNHESISRYHVTKTWYVNHVLPILNDLGPTFHVHKLFLSSNSLTWLQRRGTIIAIHRNNTGTSHILHNQLKLPIEAIQPPCRQQHLLSTTPRLPITSNSSPRPLAATNSYAQSNTSPASTRGTYSAQTAFKPPSHHTPPLRPNLAWPVNYFVLARTSSISKPQPRFLTLRVWIPWSSTWVWEDS